MVMTIVVSGEGNIHQTNIPKLNLPDGMVVYGDPVVVEDFSFGTTGSKGKITYTYNIQLLKNGKIQIPFFTLSYFDVLKEKYVTLTEKEENILIKADPNFKKQNTSIINNSEDSLNTLPVLGLKSEDHKESIFKTPYLLVSVFSVLSLVFLIVFMKRKKDLPKKNNLSINNENEDLKYSVTKNDIWDEISCAESFIRASQSDQFYTSLQKALFLICSYKLNQNSNLLNKKEIIDSLIAIGIEENVLHELEVVFNLCDEARYGLMHDSAIQSKLLEKTKSIISNI
jgi:hypothetical protein